MFESLEGSGRQGITKRLTSMMVSICLHAVIVMLVIVLPLIFLNVMPEGVLLSFLMAEPVVPKAPAPPPPPPPAGRRADTVKTQTVIWDQKPKSIPDRIPAPDPDTVVFDVVAKNVGVGLANWADVGIVGKSGPTATWLLTAPPPLPPPPAPPHKESVRIGGGVQESKLIKRVVPEYPALAKSARVQDAVLLEVRLDEEGNVAAVRVIKGHPLLVDEAVRAVKQWKYSPTLLNGEPVTVISTVTVVFRLN